jgi:anti-sigma regulatory factor (Ser/Thr protein kinase)
VVEDPPLDILDRASVAVARDRVRQLASDLGFAKVETERLALAVSELAQNQLDYAKNGQIQVRRIERGGTAGMEVVARDRGPGIPDLSGILEGRIAGKGLGAGLLSVRRTAEELDADVRYGEGCTLRARCFLGPVRRHPEVAVLGRGLEQPSGDHAIVRRSDDGLLLAVIDGAGHGRPARESAEVASAEVRLARRPAEMMVAIHDALRGGRGASATVVHFDLARETVTIAGVGNVNVRVTTPTGEVHGFRPQPGLLGSRRMEPVEQRFPLPSRSVVHVFTDGVSTRADARDFGARSAVYIAQRLFADHAKAHDDALLAVVR